MRHQTVPVVTNVKPRIRKRQDLAVRCRVDETAEEKRERTAQPWDQNVRENSLAKCCRGCAAPKVGRQTQMLASIKNHFDPEKNQIRATEQLDCAESERGVARIAESPSAAAQVVKNTADTNGRARKRLRRRALARCSVPKCKPCPDWASGSQNAGG